MCVWVKILLKTIFVVLLVGFWRWKTLSWLIIERPWEPCKLLYYEIGSMLIFIMTVLLSLRAEFGGILFYFYICDRTSLLGESTKVTSPKLRWRISLSKIWKLLMFCNIYSLVYIVSLDCSEIETDNTHFLFCRITTETFSSFSTVFSSSCQPLHPWRNTMTDHQ